MVDEAYLKVKKKGGGSGIDAMSLAALEADLDNHLFKLWNRLSSGTYFPPAVKRVDIPKRGGGTRPLGIPTVLDRIAQMVLRDYMESRLEAEFHGSSYGYRVGRNAHQALKSAENNCWSHYWVIDLDIKGFFDNLNHEKLLTALGRHFDEKWVLMYVERWLTAPVQTQEGTLETRFRGTPQGGVISPLLSNVYLHYAFDKWMSKTHGGIKFERYADDIIVHCGSEGEAKRMLESIRTRLLDCNLELHAEKTKIVYCGKGRVKGEAGYYPKKFKFLGYEFKPSRRYSQKYGRAFTKMKPRASHQAKQAMIAEFKNVIKKGAQGGLLLWASRLNGKIRGWLNYYSHFDRLELSSVMWHLNWRLVEWARKSLKRFRRSKKRAWDWLNEQYRTNPSLFAHWAWGFKP